MTSRCPEQQSQGFVLITVLVFTLVATLLSLATLRSIHLAQQQIAQHERSLREQTNLQNILVTRSKTIDMASTTIIQTTCANDMSSQPRALLATTLRAAPTPRAGTMLYTADASSLTNTASCTPEN